MLYKSSPSFTAWCICSCWFPTRHRYRFITIIPLWQSLLPKPCSIIIAFGLGTRTRLTHYSPILGLHKKAEGGPSSNPQSKSSGSEVNSYSCDCVIMVHAVAVINNLNIVHCDRNSEGSLIEGFLYQLAGPDCASISPYNATQEITTLLLRKSESKRRDELWERRDQRWEMSDRRGAMRERWAMKKRDERWEWRNEQWQRSDKSGEMSIDE